MSSQELVQVLQTVLSRPTIKPVGREYALTALMKLSTRLPDHSHYIQVTAQISSAGGTNAICGLEHSLHPWHSCVLYDHTAQMS